MKTENLTREDVLKNRETWIDFLTKKDRKKAEGYLDTGDGARCCLGHACYILGAEREKTGPSFNSNAAYQYDGEENYPGPSVIAALGLWGKEGGTASGKEIAVFKNPEFHRNTLAELNDETSAGPNRIAKYLRTVIEGGVDTPFRPLSDYPSAMSQ